MKTLRRLASLMDDLDPPWCAVCHKPVDHIERLVSASAMSWIFVVRCHGQTERAELYEEIAVVGRFHGFGEAFKTNALPPIETKQLPDRNRGQ